MIFKQIVGFSAYLRDSFNLSMPAGLHLHYHVYLPETNTFTRQAQGSSAAPQSTASEEERCPPPDLHAHLPPDV